MGHKFQLEMILPEVGEEIVGTWLRYCQGCDFVDYNVKREGPGEVDVVGINLSEMKAYICEVATHTRRGLGYKKNRKAIQDKLVRAVDYAEEHLPTVTHHYMFWAPVVRTGAQEAAIKEVGKYLKAEKQVDVEFVVNKDYKQRLVELRDKARAMTRNPTHPVMRLLQIEESLAP